MKVARFYAPGDVRLEDTESLLEQLLGAGEISVGARHLCSTHAIGSANWAAEVLRRSRRAARRSASAK